MAKKYREANLKEGVFLQKSFINRKSGFLKSIPAPLLGFMSAQISTPGLLSFYLCKFVAIFFKLYFIYAFEWDGRSLFQG
ncbi:MAG: hypothetical protein ABI707_15205 [Ferruginibacter sp.]